MMYIMGYLINNTVQSNGIG